MTTQELITAEALRQGIDPSIALAVASRESNFNQGARGTKGEIGVFQLMPATAAGLGVNPYDLADNIRGGITYLRQMLTRYGNTQQALQAYNGGPRNVDQGTVSTAAQGYARAILAALPNWGSTTTPEPTTEPAIYSAGILPPLPGGDSLPIAAAIVGAAALLMLLLD